MPADVWDVRDPAVVRAYQEEAGRRGADAAGLIWVTGHQEIAAWAAAHFAQRHRYAVGPYRVTGEPVTWFYREFVDPFQVTPGISPAEGEAEAVVRGDRIAVLSLVQSPASVRRQWGEVNAVARATAPPPAPRGPAGRRPADPAWPLALGGLAALSAVTVGLRRRRRP